MSIRMGGRNGVKKRFRKQTQTALFKRKKVCRFSGKNPEVVDYKNINLLRRYMTEKGKILPSRVTQVSTKKQKELSAAIKRARFLALLPYVSRQ